MGDTQFTYTVRAIIERVHDGLAEVLMVHNLARGQKPAGWGLFGGRVGPDDNSLKDAIARECREETGCVIDSDKFFEKGRTLARNSDSHFNCLFGGPSYDPSMGELTVENDREKGVDDVAWIPYEDLWVAWDSHKKGGPSKDLFGRYYYPTHIREIFGDG